jgi:hypothetical protein
MDRRLAIILIGGAVVIGAVGCERSGRRVVVELPDRSPPVAPPPTGAAPVTVEVSGADGRPEVPELVGRVFRVHLRRDALGLAAPAPLAPDATQVGGRSILLEGVVERADGQWLVLRSDRRLLYIPKEAVLMLELVGD